MEMAGKHIDHYFRRWQAKIVTKINNFFEKNERKKKCLEFDFFWKKRKVLRIAWFVRKLIRKIFFSGNSLHQSVSTWNKPMHQKASTQNKSHFVSGRLVLFQVDTIWCWRLFRVDTVWCRGLFQVDTVWCRGLFQVDTFWCRLLPEIFRFLAAKQALHIEISGAHSLTHWQTFSSQ
jgi:hypothetical protein